MTLEGLRALLEVIEAGSINQAAARLGVARTTLTRRLEALDAWFGTPLLNVSRDGAQPTSAGERLAAGAVRLLEQSALLDASVRLGLETRNVQTATRNQAIDRPKSTSHSNSDESIAKLVASCLR